MGMEELIPGLPDDASIECLIRVPYEYFSSITSVCQKWKVRIALPEFWRQRKTAGFTQKLIVMAQARVDPIRKPGVLKCYGMPVYRLSVFEPISGKWSELPSVPGFSDGLPMFCQLAAVGHNLVVMGGLDPVTWEATNAVFIYNFVSATWRRGDNMPGCPRSFFACTSDDKGLMVFVAGGHDCEKNALRTAMVYDVAGDKWAQLPDMASERDECKGIFHRGKFHVIGGYRTEMQGRFERSAEAFDTSTWQWDQANQDFLESATCPRTCVTDENRGIYMCKSDNIITRGNGTWQAAGQLPSEVLNSPYMTAWQEKLLTIGCSKFGVPHRAYTLDLRSQTWTKVVAPEEFSGHVQSGCYLEI